MSNDLNSLQPHRKCISPVTEKLRIIIISIYEVLFFFFFKLPSHVQLFATPWTIACQAPLSMAFFRPRYWSG